jgi:hypothetical protein
LKRRVLSKKKKKELAFTVNTKTPNWLFFFEKKEITNKFFKPGNHFLEVLVTQVLKGFKKKNLVFFSVFPLWENNFKNIYFSYVSYSFVSWFFGSIFNWNYCDIFDSCKN